jgi:DNA-directed RNA polymerase beta' subunit
VAEITNIQPYEMHSMYPTKGGINDARMGSTNRRWNCLTCQGSAIDCQGHFGHMQLAWPVYHLGISFITRFSTNRQKNTRLCLFQLQPTLVSHRRPLCQQNTQNQKWQSETSVDSQTLFLL